MFGKEINVFYQIKIINNEDELKLLKIPNAGSVSEDNNVLKTTIVYLANKKQYLDFNGVTEHEVKHIFQLSKSGNKFLVKNIKFTMPKDGYVFMKWSLAGNEAKGGGTFHPQTILVELNND